MAAGLFWAGHRLGQQGVQQAWDAERLQQQAAALQQAQQVLQIQNRQEQINQSIATDHDTRKTQLQRLWQPRQGPGPSIPAPPVAVGDGTDAHRLCTPAPDGDRSGPVPAHAKPATGADAAPSHAVPDPSKPQAPVSCEQLASDAAQTKLMVLSFQRWYAEQAKGQGGDR